jgi:hypothetical protein
MDAQSRLKDKSCSTSEAEARLNKNLFEILVRTSCKTQHFSIAKIC